MSTLGKLCYLCPNTCGIDRDKAHGLCGVGWHPVVSRVGLHMWEEPIISGRQGSGTIFFTGCNMDCVFCQNYAISHDRLGKRYTVEELAEAMRSLVEMGAHNINFVNPTHYVEAIIEALRIYRPPVPIVYNSSGYERVETLRRLEGLVDIYLPDYKYLDGQVARKYSGRGDYPEVAWAAIEEMVRQQPNTVVEDGILQKGVVIRHLVLPEQSTQSVALVERLYRRFGEDVYYSLMSQYTPYGRAREYPEINRVLKPLEYRRVVAAMERLGAEKVFVQDFSSQGEVFIPPFEGEKPE
ncbi:MAG: radical SAM protein [Clostridia bacterium]|nr:radical SAM protein [Clostridia bacterium]